jgi:hypothetical protein
MGRLYAPFPTRAGAPVHTSGLLVSPLPSRGPRTLEMAGLGALPNPWLRGRPSPTRGHARPDEPVTAGCLRNYPVVPTLRRKGDHRTVASLPT